MNQQEWNEGLNRLDPALVEQYVVRKEALRQRRRIKRVWIGSAALAACLMILIGALLLIPPTRNNSENPVLPLRTETSPSTSHYTGIEGIVWQEEEPDEVDLTGISVTARFSEALPDVYTFFGDGKQTGFRLLKMEVINVLFGDKVPDTFLFIIPLPYMTDYAVYDTFVLQDMAQYTYEYAVVYNRTQGCAEHFDVALFGYSSYDFGSLGANITAYDAHGQFDGRLWQSTEKWKKSTDNTVKNFGEEHFRQLTLQDTVEEFRRSRHGSFYCFVHSLAEVSGDAADALAYIRSSENGLYVQPFSDIYGSILGLYPEIQLSVRRYIDGFATNEDIRIYEKEVRWSTARFTKEDEQKLPDLRAAVQAVSDDYQRGDITPPHVRNLTDISRETYGIFGWYAKTPDGVIGIVRVTWSSYSEEAHRYCDDDAYFVIEYGSDECRPIDRDELLDRLGEYETAFIYTGEYDEYGKSSRAAEM